MVSDDAGFHDKTAQVLVSELVGLYKNEGVPSIGFFLVWQHKSDRNQLPVIIENSQTIMYMIQLY